MPVNDGSLVATLRMPSGSSFYKIENARLDRYTQIQVRVAKQRAKEEGQSLYPAVDCVGEVGGGNVPGNSGGGDTKVAYIFSHYVSLKT